MRLIGYCTRGAHIRYIEVTNATLAKMHAEGKKLPEGICDTCRRELEEKERDDSFKWVG